MTTTTDVWGLTDRLRKARTVAGLDTAQLADLFGQSRATVSRWENGHSTPRRSELMAYQMVTGFRWEWLETGEGEPYPSSPCWTRTNNLSVAELSAGLELVAA